MDIHGIFSWEYMDPVLLVLVLVQQLMLARICTLQSVPSKHSQDQHTMGVRAGRGRSASAFPDELMA